MPSSADLPPEVPSLKRAALAGLALACVLGGLALGGLALRVRLWPLDCAAHHLAAAECAAERALEAEMGRLQALFGTGLVVLGMALYVLVRRPAEADAPGGPGDNSSGGPGAD